MFAYRQPTFSYGSPYTTAYVPQEMPPLYLDPPQRVNGLGHISLEQLKKERHAKAFRDHQDAMQTHNRIRETREDLLDTMGVGVPNIYKRINNPKM
jgi:hypothetical protein